MTTIITYPDGTKCAELTTNSPASHYGIPALRIEGDDRKHDLGPRDIVSQDAATTFGGNEGTAAAVVANWANSRAISQKEREAARLFCAQWPDGPQVQQEGDLTN